MWKRFENTLDTMFFMSIGAAVLAVVLTAIATASAVLALAASCFAVFIFIGIMSINMRLDVLIHLAKKPNEE